MVCYHPMKVWKGHKNENGKNPIVFKAQDAICETHWLQVPCGVCDGCKLERSRQWAVRCMHEKQMHEESCFATLTYDDEHLPFNGSLNVEDFQKFMKRLRKEYGEKKIRFFQCGEYGEKFERPHHHVILFGHDFNNPENYKRGGEYIPKDRVISRMWPNGFVHVGEVTFDSAAYVSRYLLKKVGGDKKREHYADIDYDSGEILSEKKPEFVTMSRRPGIGRLWYDKFKSDVYPSDEVVMRGKALKPPRYYDKILQVEDPVLMEEIKKERWNLPDGVIDDMDDDRLRVREFISKERQKIFGKRRFENGND